MIGLALLEEAKHRATLLIATAVAERRALQAKRDAEERNRVFMERHRNAINATLMHRLRNAIAKCSLTILDRAQHHEVTAIFSELRWREELMDILLSMKEFARPTSLLPASELAPR